MDKARLEQDWVHYVRDMELDCALDFLRQSHGRKLLEIGGGDGYLARRLCALGFEVTSIDAVPKWPQHHPVGQGSATSISCADQTYDIIFSSHVIAHIEDKAQAFSELKRVLKPSGVAVHVVPSTWWTFLTNFWHFLLLPKFILKSQIRSSKPEGDHREPKTSLDSSLPSPKGETHLAEDEVRKTPQKPRSKIKERLRWMFLHPLGAHPSFLHEIILFSTWYWRKLFQRNGFEVLAVRRGPLLQSGFRIFPFKGVNSRKILATMFPSSLCFFTVPAKKT